MKIKILSLILLLLAVVSTASASKLRDDTIKVNTTWSEKDSPFFISGTVLVDTNVTLTIEPGSIVIMQHYRSKIDVRGTLISSGVTFKNFYHNSDRYKDSVRFNGEYYSKEDYKVVKAAYDLDNYETWFMPGLSYNYFNPKLSDTLGSFSGIAVEYLIYAHVGQNDNPGPSHVRVYSKLSLLNSSKSTINSMFMYSIGIDLSLEKNPKRNYLIPYFGLEFGGMSQNNLGTTVIFTPTFGIHLLSKKNLYVNANAGYVYPKKNFEVAQGWMGQVGVNFALW